MGGLYGDAWNWHISFPFIFHCPNVITWSELPLMEAEKYNIVVRPGRKEIAASVPFKNNLLCAVPVTRDTY